MFEDMTYERLLADVLGNAPDGVDTRQGSIFYDAVSGVLIKIAKLYSDLDMIVDLTRVQTATEDALDVKAGEYGITRLSATKAKYHVTFEGAEPSEGARFYTDGQYFVLRRDADNGTFYLEAEIAGASQNNIYEGTRVVPVTRIPGLTAATFGRLYESGTDSESDESLRKRVRDKISGPSENGNKQHYKTWCESVDGIGKARIFPLWNGPNTVKAVLIDGVGAPCGASKVAEVQEYIDPATKGYTATVDGRTYVVGDGLGEGVANLGAHFTAAAAVPLNITVAFTAMLADGYTKEAAEAEAHETLKAYFRNRALADNSDTVVRISAVGAALTALESVADYSSLTLNGSAGNVYPGNDYVPVLAGVVVR